MAEPARVLAVDQGTGSTRAVSIAPDGRVSPGHPVALALHSPRPGWVEQDPEELFGTVVTALRQTARATAGAIAGIGISNQRESALVWDHATGEPLGAMLGWQDRRTAGRCLELAEAHGLRIRELSGLPLDPMFSALKFEWLLDEIDPGRERATRGEIRVGTVDSWLVRRLTGDDRIEAGNASRTQLLNVHTVDWDPELLEIFRIPRSALPPVVGSDVATSPISGMGPELDGIRITGVLGDSHAALFAHGVREPGAVKTTYGTGSSIMGLTANPVGPESGLAWTIGWLRDAPARAFEGNILSTGGTLVWLGQLLDRTPQELADIARDVPDSGGINLVPAFAGLGAPWWDEGAHALIDGFDLGTRLPHLARAAVESIALQIEDVLTRADAVSGTRVETVLVDGGPARNDWLMQYQADLGARRIVRPSETGLSTLGAGHMAGLGAGLWSESDLASTSRERDEFRPAGDEEPLAARRASWAASVARSRMQPTIPLG